jgi:AcrR family transcriptional regulator
MVSESDTDEWWEGVTPAEAQRCHDGQAGAVASERAGVRRAQIIDATMRMIAHDGVAAVSTRKIAREAAVNLGILHYRFGSKDDLLLAVLDAATSAMIATLIAVDGHPGGGLRAALTESFAGLCILLDRDPALPLVRCEVLLYAGRCPAQHAGALQQQQRFLDALQACYRLACAPGELSPIAFDELAAAVGSSIDGLALQVAAGVPLSQQEATRMHVLRALLALVPAPTGPQARDDGGTAGRPVRLFEEAIMSVRKE